MDANRTKQIALWHKNSQHQKIADELSQLPPAERDYDAISWLGRAYNNLDRYEDALEQFRLIAEEGAADPIWHYRAGYAYYHLERYQEAADAFRAVVALDPEDRDAAMMLSASLMELGQEEAAEAARAQSNRPFPLDPDADATLTGIDLSSFWDDSDYALKEYVLDPPDDALIASVEEELGYKLPASYIEMMKLHNGGIPYNTCHPTSTPTSWAEDHVAISGIYGIGRSNPYSLCGDLGSRFMIEEWGYPDIGIVFCDCPSAGHDVLMLDYRNCGKDGEPQVIHVDQEADYAITYVAPNFASFIRGLVNEEVYDTSAEDKEEDLQKVKHGAFSPLLADLCSRTMNPAQTEEQIRAVCTRVVETKGFFSFHADELSLLMYDVQFGLYTQAYPQTSREAYLEAYPQMIAFGGAFSQGGYGPGFVSDWLDRRIKEGRIVVKQGGALAFTEEARAEVFHQLAEAAADEAGAGDTVDATEGHQPAPRAEDIAPFRLVDQGENGLSVILVVGEYKTELFAEREEEGFEGNGYDWASLAAVFLEERMPEGQGVIRFDPEADMFCAYSADRAALQAFAACFKQACEDDALIRDLFARAELD